MTEAELERLVRLALGKRTDCIIWLNEVGIAELPSGARIKYGLGKGTSDLIGMIRPSGRLVALELKVGNNKPSKEQQAFLTMINLGGGYARVIRSVEEAEKAVDEATKSAGAWIGRTYS